MANILLTPLSYHILSKNNKIHNFVISNQIQINGIIVESDQSEEYKKLRAKLLETTAKTNNEIKDLSSSYQKLNQFEQKSLLTEIHNIYENGVKFLYYIFK
jgi:hypothetical protein